MITITHKELINQLALLGVGMTDRTLYNYSEGKLISQPQRGSGRSGKWVEYPSEAMPEAYAAWRLLHGDYWSDKSYSDLGLKAPKLSPLTVATIRQIDAEIDAQDWSDFKRKIINSDGCVKNVLVRNGILDDAAIAIVIGYVKLWQTFKEQAYCRVADMSADAEY